jgi:hypothetical protein
MSNPVTAMLQVFILWTFFQAVSHHFENLKLNNPDAQTHSPMQLELT